MEFSRQEYWRELQFPSPGDLPNPGIEPGSLMSLALAGGFFTTNTGPGCGPFLEAVCICLVTQSCLILCDPMDCSPSGSFVHGNSPGKITGMGCHALLQGTLRTQGYWEVFDDF